MEAQISSDVIRVEGREYSSKTLADLHPGGPFFIKVRLNFITKASWQFGNFNYVPYCEITTVKIRKNINRLFLVEMLPWLFSHIIEENFLIIGKIHNHICK